VAHSHGSPDLPDPQISEATKRGLTFAVAPMIALTLIGLVVLWPRGPSPDLAPGVELPAELIDGTVTATQEAPCPGVGDLSGPQCLIALVELTSGSEAGRTIELDVTPGPASPGLGEGDRIVLGHVTDLPAGAPAAAEYYFADYQRDTPLVLLAVLFAAAVVALGRWRGLRALAALAVSLGVLVWFVLPAILQGRSPVAVAIVGAAVIMTVALYVSHGLNVRTTSALLGTLLSLGLTGALASVFVTATQLTGLASDEAVYLQVSAETINLQGLILAGIIIGSLGVLDDVTVTQASAVWELRKANRSWGFAELYRPALRIGRDHIASTVNTLVLAYAGASLPLLVLFTQAERPLGEVAAGEVVATEIVRTLVGSLGLIASVPVTTALTAAAVVGRPRRRAAPEPGEPDSQAGLESEASSSG
jgi:uncharacterized membrane protein